MSEKLPNIDELKPLNDEELISYITTTIKAVKNEDKGNDNFYNYLTWALQVLTTKSYNKSQALYKAGFIFVGSDIALNASNFSKLFGLTITQLNRRLKEWTNTYWDINQKKAVLMNYDLRADLRQWVLKKVPKNDPVRLYFAEFAPSINETEEITFLNKPPPPNHAQLSTISLDFFKQMDFVTRKNVSISPKVWTFENKPDEVLLFGY